MPPQIRVHGELSSVPGQRVLTGRDTNELLAELITPERASGWDATREYDFSFSWREHARVRGNAFTQRGQTALALRMIPRQIPTMAHLGVPPILGCSRASIRAWSS